MKLTKLTERFKLWKLKRKHLINGSFPIDISFYKTLFQTFGKDPITHLTDYASHISSNRITLYTKDVYELRALLTFLHTTILKDGGFNQNKRLADGTLEDVGVISFRNYLAIEHPSNVDRPIKALLECMELTLQCIQTIQSREKNDNTSNTYYATRVLLLATDFADIYYALILFYLET